MFRTPLFLQKAPYTASSTADANDAAPSSTGADPSVAQAAAASTAAAAEALKRSAEAMKDIPAPPGSAKLDVDAKARLKVAEAMTDAQFDENAEILKKLGLRGLRAFLVGAVGVGLFAFAMRRKKQALAEAEEQEEVEDPTERYLREMDEQGWDVEEGEKELRKIRAKKAAQ